MRVFLIIFTCLTFLLDSAFSQCSCLDITDKGNLTITIQSVAELSAALQQADNNNGNMTIKIEPGVYELSGNLRFISENMADLTIIGSTGNRDDVIIKGQGWNDSSVTHIFSVAADRFTLAHVTIGEVYYHPVQVHSNPSDADDFTIQNVRIIDAKEQLLKVSGGGTLFADRGKVLCCEFEFTNGIAYQFYTGGIDAHRSKDWIVQYNRFIGIRSPEANLAEHAIHFWRESSGTLVESNQIIACDRGIGFGLGTGADNGHEGGIIANNFVHTNRDVGIGLETSPNTAIYNNTVMTENYQNSIEYRFAATSNVNIVNNLVNGNITDRSSGSSGSLSTNYTFNSNDIFVDAATYDYHILDSATDIIDNGTPISNLTTDYDCTNRVEGSGIDIGADELSQLISSTDVLLGNESLTLFPNPTQGIFTIQGELTNYNIQIVDSVGSIFQEVDQASGTIEINLSNLPGGLYFARIEHKLNAEIYLQTIIKI